MPKLVDKDERLREITDAANELLVRNGPRALTIRALADRLGGSVTLVTHYFPRRELLLESLFERLFTQWESDIQALRELPGTPLDRLRALIIWLLPYTDEYLQSEVLRIHLISQREGESTVDALITRMDPLFRGVVREFLTDLVPEDELALTTDVLRSFTNGVSLSAIEDPEHWDPARQARLLDYVFTKLGLT